MYSTVSYLKTPSERNRNSTAQFSNAGGGLWYFRILYWKFSKKHITRLLIHKTFIQNLADPELFWSLSICVFMVLSINSLKKVNHYKMYRPTRYIDTNVELISRNATEKITKQTKAWKLVEHLSTLSLIAYFL